jgi:ubiquinone/menaquinone biosynthesis C-methylase UbiE
MKSAPPKRPPPVVSGDIYEDWPIAVQDFGHVPSDRDVAAFDDRAKGYENGWLGKLHRDIADRTAAIALALVPTPSRILDVGCGTGYLLRLLGARCPAAVELVGLDPAPRMIEEAKTRADDDRLTFSIGSSEDLPLPDGTFDLVVSTTSFDHWADQRSGLAECERVMRPGAYLVLADLFSALLVPTLLLDRQGKARTKRRATRLLADVGLRSAEWHDLYPLIKAVTVMR